MDNHSRFSSADWFDVIAHKNVLLGGAGGIGSWTALLLARTNVGSIRIYDDDKVETANLAGQFFSISDVGKYKVEAVTNHLRNIANYYSSSYVKDRFTLDTPPYKIMIGGFDNMTARKVFFRSWNAFRRASVAEDFSNYLLIDARLSAEVLQVYCLQGDDEASITYYKDNCLFSDDEADPTVCSYKQTSFMANMIAGTIANLFVNWCANKAGGFRPVPFFTEYDAVTMQYKLKMNAV